MFSISALFVALGLFGLSPVTETDVPPKEKNVTVEGTLKHPVYAIGGETTGTVVETKKDGTFELDLGKDKDLLKQIEALKGKEVKVTGTLRIVKGVEIPERRLIAVKELTAVKK